MGVVVREMKADEWREWSSMRQALYDGLNDADAETEARAFLEGRDPNLKIVYLALLDEEIAGFCELSERSYAEGCFDGPVAYFEGWYVRDFARRKGVGRALLDAAIAWAKSKNYPHLASDAELSNTRSQAVHKALGFEEVERAVHFKMALK